MVEVAELEAVDLRSVWADEARDFTPWLADHPHLLGRETRVDLELEGHEVAVGFVPRRRCVPGHQHRTTACQQPEDGTLSAGTLIVVDPAGHATVTLEFS